MRLLNQTKWGLLLLLFAVVSCTKPEKIMDDFQVHISPTFYKYVIDVELYDLNDPEAAFTTTTAINISGPNADAIYNIDGTKNFKVNFGRLSLMVARQYEPTEDNPLQFQIEARANGFQANTLRMTVEPSAFYQQVELPLLNLANLPSSVNTAARTGAVDPVTNTLAAPIEINTGTQDSTSRMKLVIPTDVKFLDANGNEIVAKQHGGNLEVNVLSFSDTTESAQMAMPNGGGLAQPLELDGELMNELLEPTATFKIDMSIGGVPVKSFSGGKTSGGISSRIPVPSHMYNEEFDRDYQAGDSLSLMSLSDGDPSWTEEPVSYLVKQDPNTNQLYIDANIDHLSFWRLRRRRRFRPVITYMSLTGHLKDAAPGNSLNGTLFYRYTVQRGFRRVSRWLRVSGSFTAQGSRMNPRINLRLRGRQGVFGVRGSFGTNFRMRININTVGRFRVYDTEIEPINIAPMIGYRLFCGSSNTLVTPPAGVKMYFKRTGTSDPFRHLHTFTNENLSVRTARMPLLTNNVRYDFRAQFNDTQVDTSNVLIQNGRVYDVRLPNRACNALGL